MNNIKPVKIALYIFFFLFIAYSLPDHKLKNHNQNSRYDLTFAIVDKSSLTIDAYHLNTQDKSFIQGHFYTDKAIGLSIIGVPVYYIAKKYFSAIKINLTPDMAAYLIRVFTVSLSAAAGASFFFLLIFSISQNISVALTNTAILSLCSPYYVYATMFYGHSVSASLIIIAFWLLSASSEKYKKFKIFSAGYLLSFSVMIEYPVFMLAAPMSLFYLINKKFAWSEKFIFSFSFLPVIITQLLYNYYVNGGLFKIGYDNEHAHYFKGMMQVGIYGIYLPSLKNMIFMLFSSERGLLFYSPVLIFVFLQFLSVIKNAITKLDGNNSYCFASLCFAFFFIIISGYFEISGGWAYSIRHLIPALPFLIFGSSINIKNKKKFLFVFLLMFYSAFLSVFALITDPQMPDHFKNPIFEYNIELLKNEALADFALINIIKIIPIYCVFIGFLLSFLYITLYRNLQKELRQNNNLS